MSETVVALPGFAVPPPAGKPIDKVVAICEDLLAEAMSGRLRAIAVAKVLTDPQVTLTETQMWSGPSPDKYFLLAAAAQLDFDIKDSAYGNDAD